MTAAWAMLALGVVSAHEPPGRGPKDRSPSTPEQALDALRVDRGLRVELVAAEPQVESPVAIAFDESGRLWVVEMRDYPNGPPPGGRPEGRIKVLEDRDGDGRYEHASVFDDELLFANGLMPWRDGVIVTAAPHIVHLRDTDGDGRADRREVLYEGFAAENPQLRVSHPVLGPDGWVYVANGLRGGKVRRAGRADVPAIDLSGRDLRFELVHDRAEPVAGMGQFGNTFDDWGHRFVCTNRNHLVPIVLEDRYVRRNPHLAAPGPRSDNQGAGGAARSFPLSRGYTTSSLHEGSFSAACGVTIYRGALLPEPYRGSAFTCDPTGNLVHQEVLTPSGASFTGRPPREGVEFLASPDDRFRPVSLAHGPDGALFVVDMARAVIEHPEFMPPELRDRPDLLLGKDRGRIWRIVPEGYRDPKSRPPLGTLSIAELVATLDHPDGWWRTTAQRLLLQAQAPAAVEPLRKTARASRLPEARVLAAWLLEGSGNLDEETIRRLLASDHPRLREHGVLLAERRLAGSEALRGHVIALAADPDPRVRFQAALSLGAWDDDGILDSLAAIALAGAEDPWTRLAVGTAVPGRAGALIRTLLRPPHNLPARDDPDRLTLLHELASLVGAQREPEEIARVLDALAAIHSDDADRWRLAALNGLAEGTGRRGTNLGEILAGLPPGAGVRQAGKLLADSASTAEDHGRDPAMRLDATRLLAQAPREIAAPVLARLLATDPLQEVRIAAVRALAARAGAEVAEPLLEPWKTYTPAVRREVTQALLSRPERCLALLSAIEDGRLAPGELDAAQAQQLRNHPRPEVHEKARALLAPGLPAERRAILDRYRAATEGSGDAARGLEVFRRVCATCHRVRGVGTVVGPDIGDTRTKTREMLLADILDPNAAIDGNYVTYTVATHDGRILSGVISGEDASGLTLRRAEGQADTVLRTDIEEIRSTGVSLMPEGVERDVTVEEMTDLLAFLKGWRELDPEEAR
jgi:putative membrane-bound dehydrogenase-like protein